MIYTFETSGRDFAADFDLPQRWRFLDDLSDGLAAAIKSQVKARFDVLQVEENDLEHMGIRFTLDAANGWAVSSELFELAPAAA